MTPTRLSVTEWQAILSAVTQVTAGASDGWTDQAWAALSRAEDKIRERLQRKTRAHDERTETGATHPTTSTSSTP